MKSKNMKKSQILYSALIFDQDPLIKRYFFKLFKSKAKRIIREGVLSAEELKKKINEIGKNKKVNITRLAYDGQPEDKPTTVKIIDIRDDHFTGKVINVERSIKQSEDQRVVYIKGGGGTIDFYYSDEDISSIEEDIDEEIIEQRNIDEIKEILDALDINEDIIISYYDENEGGVINGVGVLSEKNMETLDFKLSLKIINEIELSHPREVSLNLNRNNILDLEVVL
jgi:hypothetical protein